MESAPARLCDLHRLSLISCGCSLAPTYSLLDQVEDKTVLHPAEVICPSPRPQ